MHSKFGISKSENIEINEEESDDEDEVSKEKMPPTEVNSETITTENEHLPFFMWEKPSKMNENE